MILEPTSEKGYPSWEAVNSRALNIWEQVIEQIRVDLDSGDETALYELLKSVDRAKLIAYLPEEQWQRFTDSK
jgi:hypothetical protein